LPKCPVLPKTPKFCETTRDKMATHAKLYNKRGIFTFSLGLLQGPSSGSCATAPDSVLKTCGFTPAYVYTFAPVLSVPREVGLNRKLDANPRRWGYFLRR
jgi:hypothetical protein